MSGRLRWTSLVALAMALASSSIMAGTASAKLALEPAGVTFELLDSAGEPEDRAGVHPDRLIQSFKVSQEGGSHESIRDMAIELPAGLSGDTTAVPTCPRWRISAFFFGECPADTQVGTLLTGGEPLPLYNIQPGPNEAAAFGVKVELAFAIVFTGKLRPGGGLTLELRDIEESPFFELSEGTIELWGIPADHQSETEIPRKPLLTTPTTCTSDPPKLTISVRSWQRPGEWVRQSADTGHPLTGCEDLPFAPTVGFSLDDGRADVPSGARIELDVPQSEDPDGRAGAQVEDVKIAFPEGMTLAPGSAAGLVACTDAELDLEGEGDPSCPGASRVGSVELRAPGIGPMHGSIYLGQGHPGDRFRLFVAAAAAGSEVKLAASLRVDPETGRLTADLADLPAAAFERLILSFDGGPGALLATPLECGSARLSATIAPNSGGAAVYRTASVAIGAPGGTPCSGSASFAPRFAGGSTNAAAGRATGFTTTVGRDDGEQLPERLTIGLPLGVSAMLGQVDRCPGEAVASGTCGPGSRVGSALAELGPGETPARLEGGIFLTGPYRGAPFGIAIVFEAKLGSFDLGRIAVRGALRVNPLSGRVTVATDPLPSIVEGVPVRFQTLGLDFDRPGFMRNPTSCAPSEVTAYLRSSAGTSARVSTPFRARDCLALRFRPRFTLRLTGGRQARRPGLQIRTRVPAADANLRATKVLLPSALRFDSSGLREICARGAAIDGRCPTGSRVGSAHARSPMLGVPLKGSIYVVQPRDNGPPDLWVGLHGDGLQVEIRGETAIDHGRLETRLVGLPDFQLRSFTMRLAGGRRGLFRLDGGSCQELVASVGLGAQNGAARRSHPRISPAGGCGRE